MTKKEVIKGFRYLYGNKADFLEELHNDRAAVCLDWDSHTDLLCMDGKITENQYNNWACPFSK